ncbi:MAG: coenzyme F420-0:L-glutamate ligase [Acidimicrobiales bacterium]|jgi:coenzyme F420-0:L-glutamate ligase/coenzyme F420-1:gamma-L-glutamate ligase
MPAPEQPGPVAGTGAIAVHPITGLAEVRVGDDLAELIVAALDAGGALGGLDAGGALGRLVDGDVVVVTQKIVSKAEGRIVPIDPDDPEAKRRLVEQESVRIVRRRGDLLISETRHGFICANAGVDLSNVDAGTAALLPVDADRSARRIREGLEHRHGVSVGVIVSDTFGRTWRRGVTDVAIGIAGVAGVEDLRGTADATGRVLEATEVCIADELASAAELVMGKDRGIPVAVVRGVDPRWLRPASVATEIVRPPGEDLFR